MQSYLSKDFFASEIRSVGGPVPGRGAPAVAGQERAGWPRQPCLPQAETAYRPAPRRAVVAGWRGQRPESSDEGAKGELSHGTAGANGVSADAGGVRGRGTAGQRPARPVVRGIRDRQDRPPRGFPAADAGGSLAVGWLR